MRCCFLMIVRVNRVCTIVSLYIYIYLYMVALHALKVWVVCVMLAKRQKCVSMHLHGTLEPVLCGGDYCIGLSVCL